MVRNSYRNEYKETDTFRDDGQWFNSLKKQLLKKRKLL